jgi:sulfopyruvate decarboxylase alpha subunit
MVETANEPAWPGEIFKVFEEEHIRQIPYVPDAGHTRLIQLCEAAPSMRTVSLTTEEEGIALLAGAWLGGDRGALLMQSSGAGNCINMLALVQECRIPLLMLVTMRGQWAEFNPWQVPMGQGTASALHGAGVIVETVLEPSMAAATVSAAAATSFNSSRAVAVLIHQRVIGVKQWEK